MSTPRPVVLAVGISIFLLLGLIVVASAIGGSYAVALHVSHVQQAQDATFRHQLLAQQAKAQVQETAAQIRGSLPGCRAFHGLDKVGARIREYNPAHHLSYGFKLARAIHQVYITSKCGVLIHDVRHHVPFAKILRQLKG